MTRKNANARQEKRIRPLNVKLLVDEKPKQEPEPRVHGGYKNVFQYVKEGKV